MSNDSLDATTILTRLRRKELAERLREPFSIDQVKWRRADGPPQSGQVWLMPYLDARDVMDRLDDVLGMTSWHATFVQTDVYSVVCTIHVEIEGQAFEKTDVGTASAGTQPDIAVKAAYSDSLKRAAVHLGVGRYLYSVPKVLVPVDQYGQPKVRPNLPDHAMTAADREACAAAVPIPVVQAPAMVAQPVQQNGPLTTQRLGGDGREPVQRPIEVQLPHIDVLASHQELWKQMGPDDLEYAMKIGNAIGIAAGPNGSRVLLRRYYDAYSTRDNVPNLVRQYLDAFIVEAWANTPVAYV
jgi:hypothetical protein